MTKLRSLFLVAALLCGFRVSAQTDVLITISNATGFQLNNIGILTTPTGGFVATVPYSTSLTAGGYISAFAWDTYAGGSYYFFGAYPPGGSTYGQVYVNGSYAGGYGGSPSVTLTAGNTYNIVIYPTGYTPPSGPLPQSLWTNSGCLTLQNNGASMKYYQFSMTSTNGQHLDYNGCSPAFNYQNEDGSSPGPATPDLSDWYALGPGQSVTVCGSLIQSNSAYWQLGAYSSPANWAPCDSVVGFGGDVPHCVHLCLDGQQMSGVIDRSVLTPEGYVTLGQTTGTSASQSVDGLATTNNAGNNGTNGINWLPSGTNLLTEVSGQQGFATLHGDLTTLNNNLGLDSAAIVSAIRTSSVSVTLSNLVFSNQVNVSNVHDLIVESNTTAMSATLSNLYSVMTNTNRMDMGNLTNTGANLLAGTNAAASIQSGFSSVGASISNGASANVSGNGAGSSGALTFTLGMSTFHPLSVDLDPADSPTISAAASWLQGILKFVVSFSLVMLVLRDIQLAVGQVGMAPQGSFPKVDAAGFTVGLVGAPVYLAALLALVAGIIVGFCTLVTVFVGPYVSQISGAMFNGTGVGSGVAAGLYLLGFFFPVNWMVTAAFSYMLFKMALTTAVGAGMALIRALMA